MFDTPLATTMLAAPVSQPGNMPICPLNGHDSFTLQQKCQIFSSKYVLIAQSNLIAVYLYVCTFLNLIGKYETSKLCTPIDCTLGKWWVPLVTSVHDVIGLQKLMMAANRSYVLFIYLSDLSLLYLWHRDCSAYIYISGMLLIQTIPYNLHTLIYCYI